MEPTARRVPRWNYRPSERARAAAFRFPRDQRRYLSARVALRRILYRYAGVPPEAIRVRLGSGSPDPVVTRVARRAASRRCIDHSA